MHLKIEKHPLLIARATTITPTSATVELGQSVGFGSSTTGGTGPYTYQWYLNGNPVQGANSPGWVFAPTLTGTYFVHLKVTDSLGHEAQSAPTRVTVLVSPGGGYSVSTAKQPSTPPIMIYVGLVMLGLAALVLIRRKRE